MKAFRLRRIFGFWVSILLLGGVMGSCEYFDVPWSLFNFSFYNHSNDTIYVFEWLYQDKDSVLTAAHYYNPDYDLTNHKAVLFPGDSMNIYTYDYMKDNLHRHQIMVFKKSTLDSIPRSEIIEKNRYDTLMMVYMDDLVKSHFKIYYK